MPHPVIMPLLLIPHVAIPAGLIYLLYLDQQEMIVQVQTVQPPVHKFQVLDSDLNVIKQDLPSKARLNTIDPWFCTNPIPSPMSTYIKENKYALHNRAHLYLWNVECRRIYRTPMRDLASSNAFQTELDTMVEKIYVLRTWQRFWKETYSRQIVCRIAQQYGIVTSKLAKCMRSNVWYAFIDNEIRMYDHSMFMKSPMRKLTTTLEFRDHLYCACIMRIGARYFQENGPMHIVAVNEQDNILRLARQMGTSKMHRFVSDPNNRMAIVYLGSKNVARAAEMTSSPLRVWTHNNSYQLNCRAAEFSALRVLRSQTLQTITDLLARNYGTLYRKYTLKEYRLGNGIPEVQFAPNCNSYANIIFPPNVQLIDRFLADSNLDGFIAQTVYTDRNHYQCYALSLLTSGTATAPSIDDLTDAAQTFKNISHLTHEETQVQILSDSTKITFDAGSSHMTKRYMEFYFVRRDRSDFNSSDYKTCNARITEFLKRFPKLEYTLGFVGRWLSDTMVLRVTGPYDSACDATGTDGKYINVVTDLIRVVNLVKGVIFQKVIDRTVWIQLGS